MRNVSNRRTQRNVANPTRGNVSHELKHRIKDKIKARKKRAKEAKHRIKHNDRWGSRIRLH